MLTGNESLFRTPCTEALYHLRFAPPTKDGKPTRAYAEFSWVIKEPNLSAAEVRFH